MAKKIYLVLGAGLGLEYGFPDNKKLREILMDELEPYEKGLKEILRVSYADTIDEVADKYNGHRDTLRRMTAKILLRGEDEEVLMRHGPNTYKRLLKQIVNARLNGDTTKILTFNYDRSLQYLIYKMNAVAPVQSERIDPSIVTPFFGRLPLMDCERGQKSNTPYRKYGGEVDIPMKILDNREYQDDSQFDEFFSECNMSFICQGSRADLTSIKRNFEEADLVLFLGFGYHKANMDMLGFDFSKKHPKKLIVGTALGCSKSEIARIQRKFPALEYLYDCNAYDLLTNSFDLSDFDAHVERSKETFFA